MTTLEWNETEEGYTTTGYRITRAGHHKWMIDLDPTSPRSLTGRKSTDMRVFGSLKSARAAALHMEIVRVRRLKLIRHVAVSLTMLGLSVACYVTMATGTQSHRLEWFVLAGAALYLGLREGLDAFVLVVSDGWDHRYEVPRVTALDRIASSAVVLALWRRSVSGPPSHEQERVRPLSK